MYSKITKDIERRSNEVTPTNWLE